MAGNMHEYASENKHRTR